MKKISLTQSEIDNLKELYQSEIGRAQRRIESLKSILKKIEKENLSIEPEEKIVKKRGRKPKVTVAQTLQETPSSPKKRGRKPKNTTVAAEAAKEPKKRGRKPKNADASAEVVQEIKKRGRKPKAKPAEENVKKTKTTRKNIKPIHPPKKRKKSKSLRKSLKQAVDGEKIKWIDLILSIFKKSNSLLNSNALTIAAIEKLNLPEVEKDRVRMAVATNLTKLTKYDKKIVKYIPEGSKTAVYGLAEWFNENGSLRPEYQEREA